MLLLAASGPWLCPAVQFPFFKFEMLLLCWPDSARILVKGQRCQLTGQDIGWQAKTLVEGPMHWLKGQDIGWQAKISVNGPMHQLMSQEIGQYSKTLVEWLRHNRLGYWSITCVYMLCALLLILSLLNFNGKLHLLREHNNIFYNVDVRTQGKLLQYTPGWICLQI